MDENEVNLSRSPALFLLVLCFALTGSLSSFVAGCRPTCQHRRRHSLSRCRASWHLRVVPRRSRLKLVVRKRCHDLFHEEPRNKVWVFTLRACCYYWKSLGAMDAEARVNIIALLWSNWSLSCLSTQTRHLFKLVSTELNSAVSLWQVV